MHSTTSKSISVAMFAALCCAQSTAFAAGAISPAVIGAPASSAEITDRYGGPLRFFLSEKQAYSRPVSIDDVSPWLILSALAAEDKRFFDHPGVDMRAALRALWQNATAGRTVSGASTITQPLARALEPRPRTLSAKISEMFSELKLERKLSKREILENYFNSVPYGNMAVGIEAASRMYFNAPAGELSPAQAALLSGIPKSPQKYDPVFHFDNAIKRQRIVLRRMLDAGYINDELYARALSEKIVIRHDKRPFIAPQFALYRYPEQAFRLRAAQQVQ